MNPKQHKEICEYIEKITSEFKEKIKNKLISEIDEYSELLTQNLSEEFQIFIEDNIKNHRKNLPKPKIFARGSMITRHPTPPEINQDWPEAVPHNRIARTDDDNLVRAFKVISKFKIESEGKVLDYGCGGGHMARALRSLGQDAQGYDIVKSWDDKYDFLTSDRDRLSKYDLIVCYDVIDHSSNTVDLLKDLGSLLDDGGKIVLVTHPWTSRHGAHQYLDQDWNKAFLHLVLTDDQLQYKNVDCPHNIKISRPISGYNWMIYNAGLDIVSYDTFHSPVEPFFGGEILDRIIDNVWSGNIDNEQALNILSTDFVRYELTL